MKELFFLTTLGYIVQLLVDISYPGEIKRHAFYLTRQTYLAMWGFFLLQIIGVDYFMTDTYLRIFAPLSIAICFGYLGLDRPWDQMRSASSMFGHVVMPLLALYELLSTPSKGETPWYVPMVMLGFYALHYGGQWAYTLASGKPLYDETNIKTGKGNLKSIVTPAIALAISLLHMFIDLSNKWIFYATATLMIGAWTARAIIKISQLPKPTASV